jgi:hypothetical protein
LLELLSKKEKMSAQQYYQASNTEEKELHSATDSSYLKKIPLLVIYVAVGFLFGMILSSFSIIKLYSSVCCNN